jgi:catechol 2,3-dioxygenase-like lactoylglutathione lyase family enzyme
MILSNDGRARREIPVTGRNRIHGRSRIRHDVIHRIVPNLNVRDPSAGHDFYVDFLGLKKQFDLGWVVSFRSPENRSIQVSLVSRDASAPEDSAISVAVDDVDAAYSEARERG